MRRFRPIHWLLDRLGLLGLPHFFSTHRVPAQLAGRRGWMYVFGAATLVAFLIAALTGVTLATIYVPSPAHAYDSLQQISQTPFGAFLRATHFYAASAMVLMLLVHMARTYLTASYKFPREMNWISGVLLLVLVFGSAITGQLLRWDEDGIWTVVVGANFVARVPWMGAPLAEFVLAGPEIGAATLTRFFALHVFILPLSIAGLVGLHLYLVIHHGISEPPTHEVPVDRKTYVDWYKGQKEKFGILYWPDAVWREAVMGSLVLAVIVTLAIVLGPRGPGRPPDPTAVTAEPHPDWFVQWYYALLYLKPRSIESLVMVYGPILLVVGLIALPLVFGIGERRMRRRPWALPIVGVSAVVLGTLLYMGRALPWLPAYGTRPLGPAELGVTAGPVLEGARLFHERGCQYCHRVLGEGGRWAPDLTQVSLRLSPEETAVRIVMGFGDMPGYQGVLTQDELEALMSFLRALPDLPGGRRDGARR